jgi:integrase
MKRKPIEPKACGGVKAKDKHPVRLDNDYVRKLAPPKAGAVTVWDDDPKATGFGVRIYSSGARSFFVNYRVSGRERRHTIGPFPRWSVAAARERAKELRREIDQGHDPAGEKRERREAPTVQDLIDRYIEEHLPTKRGGMVRITDEKTMLAIIGDHLGKHTKVGAIHDGDIGKMHREITESRGPIRANRILACASKMFSLALQTKAGEDVRWRNSEQGNPCKGVPRNPEEGRERFFGKAELERIAEALAEYPPAAYDTQKEPGRAAADCVRLITLTGARPSEAMKAEWSEFDKEGHWIKPSSHTKQKKIHRLPLSPPAIQLIEKLRKHRTSAKWVFPGRVPGEPVRTLLHVWNFVRERAKLEPDEKGRPARVYDLRHTYASVAVTGNLNLPIIGKLLGHTQQKTTQRYAHVADDPLREAANRIGAVIAGGESAELVRLKTRND